MKQTKTVAFHSFGCKLNQSETQSLEEEFRKRGYVSVPFSEKADYYLIDTCTVTDQADLKCRNIIRKAGRTNPKGRIVVTGCMAQMEAEQIKKISPKSLVLGTFEKFKLFDILADLEKADDWENAIFIDENKIFRSSRTRENSKRTRAFLKIQDGCDYICSFCIIPFSRGRDRSASLSSLLEEAENLISEGYKEISLTGVNIGEFKNYNYRIDDLIEKLSSLDGLKRLRISSIEPNTVSDRLISLVNERENIMPHLHIPIQSGSSEILKKMRRHYDGVEIRKILDRICNVLPNIGLGSDFIVGFPQESDKNFLETVKLIDDYPFTYFHTFSYSSRQKTIAQRMEGHIEKKIKSQRSNNLRNLSEEKKYAFAIKNLASVQNVLFETAAQNGRYSGFTENYIKVHTKSNRNLENKIIPVKLEKISDQKMVDSIINYS